MCIENVRYTSGICIESKSAEKPKIVRHEGKGESKRESKNETELMEIQRNAPHWFHVNCDEK